MAFNGKVLRFPDKDALSAAFEEYKAVTKSNWRCTVSSALFGQPMADVLDLTKNSFRLKWKWEVGDGITIASDGIPFFCVSRKRFQCHHGPDRDKRAKERRKKLKEEKQDNENGLPGKKFLVRKSKKLGCPAKLHMSRIIKFPQYQVKCVSMGRAWSKEERLKSVQLRKSLEIKNEIEAVDEYILFLPDENSHLYHDTIVPDDKSHLNHLTVLSIEDRPLDHGTILAEDYSHLSHQVFIIEDDNHYHDEANSEAMEYQASDMKPTVVLRSEPEDDQEIPEKNYENVKVDASVPNPSWSQELTKEYEFYSKLEEEGSWKRCPTIFDSTRTNRLFTRALPPTGMMFEYVCFLKKDENLMHAAIQFGPWLEGPKGYVHGGAIATIFDSIMGKHLHQSGYTAATMNLNVDYKKPLPVGIVGILESKIEGQEGRKIFTSGILRSVDKSVIFNTSKGLWFDFKRAAEDGKIK